MMRWKDGIVALTLSAALAVATETRAVVSGSDWAVDGNQAGAGFGEHVTLVGDVNGDGYSDVVVGAPLWGNIVRPEEGRAFLYLGSESGLATTAAWSASVSQSGAHFGSSAAGAGDVNGDGYDDVLVAAPDYNGGEPSEGLVNLYLGSPSGLSTSAAWSAEGTQSNCVFGLGLAGVGDLNGDGYDDVVIGAPRYNNEYVNAGLVHVYHGSDTGLPATPNSIREGQQEYAYLGSSIASAGDVNADGLDDVIIGGFTYGTNAEGAAFVYLGTIFGMAQAPVWMGEGNQDYAYYGITVAGVGDVNADGYGDVLVGSYYYDHSYENEGAAFLYYGKATGVNSAADWSFYGGDPDASFGRSVAPAGDMNADGFADIVIGAPYYDIGHLDEGVIGVFYGSADGPSHGADLLYFGGQDAGFFGYSVSSAGDVDGDGYGDVIAGAYSYDDPESGEGEAFAFYGGAGDLQEQPNWTIGGSLTDAAWGRALAFGDFNSDGFGDLVTGSPLYDGGQNDEGKVGVSYGGPGGPDNGFDWAQEGNIVDHWFGQAVASADVNNDGFDDLLVGAPSKAPGETGGNLYLYHGSVSGLSPSADLVLDSSERLFAVAVANAGDVDGDGFVDVIVGVSAANAYMGKVYLYKGSAQGLEASPSWSYEGEGTIGTLGSHLAGGGDVNGDGYSDFVVGAPSYSGKVLAFFGGPDGPGTDPNWTRTGPSSGSLFGYALAFGDVNADGHSDVLIGAPHDTQTYSNEGRVYVFLGSASGIDTVPAWTRLGGRIDAELGWTVAGADIDTDGRSDVAVAARGWTSGESYEGKAFLYLSPLTTVPTWVIEGGQEEARLGHGLAAGGDVNGDGFADLAISSPTQNAGMFTFGKVSLFLGGEGGGIARGVQQARTDESTRISLLGGTDGDAFRILMHARTSFGRDAIRFEYEIEPAGSPFDGIGIVSTDWLDTGVPVLGEGSVLDVSELINGLASGDAVHWRARVVTNSPWFPVSPWYSPAGNSSTEWDLRIGEGSTSDTPEAPVTSGLRLALAGPNPFGAQADLVYELPETMNVRVQVFDTSGRLVSMLAEGMQVAGAHYVRWNGVMVSGEEAPSGMYFARVEAGDTTRAVRLVRAR